MTGEATLNFDDLMFTSIDSEDFLVNEEKPSLSSSFSSDCEKDCHWKSSNSSMSQLQSPPKQSDLPVSSTPVHFESGNSTKFLTCHELPVDNTRSLSRVNISDILDVAPNDTNNFSSAPRPRARRSLSLHDLDNAYEFPSNKLAKNANSSKMSHSLASSKTRSKDSGIHRTASCISLLSNNTYSRKYDHVQSKVKQYIQSMKELGTKNRLSKNIRKASLTNNSESRISMETVELTEEKYNELKNEILEKDLLISTYHEKYTSLQMKYVSLKQQYDALRFGSPLYNESFSPDQLDYSAGESVKPDCSHSGLGNRPFQSCIVSEPVPTLNGKPLQLNISHLGPNDESFKSCSPSTPVSPSNANAKLLKPITKLHSTSANLNRQLVTLQPGQVTKNSSSSKAKDDFSKSDSNSEFSNLESADIRGDDPFLKVKRWQESLTSSKLNASSVSSSAPVCDRNEDTYRSRKAKPRRRPKKSRQGGDVPDVLQNLTRENRIAFEDSRGADSCQRPKPVLAENVFRPACDSNDSWRSVPKPDMLPFASSTLKSNLNKMKYYASQSSVSQSKNGTTLQKSSQIVPMPFSPEPGSSSVNNSVEKASKSALCCCLEASDLYINQLNEGLDKLMIALTELGTSTVFKS